MGLLLCRQAQLQQGHEDYQSGAKREQREQERRRADQARDAERKTREEVGACQFTFVLVMKQIIGRSYTLVQVPCDSMHAQVTAATVCFFRLALTDLCTCVRSLAVPCLHIKSCQC